jgi:hypothetical protein
VDEKVVAVATQFNLDGVTRTVGDLVFTTRRVIFAKTAGNTDVVFHLFGAIGALISARRSRKASAELRGATVEDLVVSAREMHDYSTLERVQVKPRALFSSVIRLHPRGGKRRKFWGKKKDLADLLTKIDELAASGAPIELG